MNDVFGTNETNPSKRPLIRRVRDYWFATFAFPLSIDVSGMFWLLYSIDREMVLPKTMDSYFPGWYNHIMHTNIAIFVALEMIFSYHKYPCYKGMMAGLLTFILSYTAWVHVVKYVSGRWVYGVLDEFDDLGRIGFFAFQNVLPIMIYFGGKFINNLIWKSRLSEVSNEGRKKPKRN